MSIELNEGLIRIEAYTFSGCMSLHCIKFPTSVKIIGSFAFSLCEQLRNVELFEGLEDIEDGAFDMCTSLEHITLPSTLKSI